MKILSVDTSSKFLSLAISDNEKVLRYQNIILGRKLSTSIVSMIRSLLKKANMDLKDLDGFAVGLGPGAFTSLRVGLATIKGLAFATDKPIVGISSLDVLAMNIKDNGNICVICDARRELVYSCCYIKKGNKLIRNGEYLLTDIQTVLKQIQGDTFLIGDGIKVFKKDILKSKQEKFIILADEKIGFPQAKHLSYLVLDRFKKKDFDHVSKLVPLYLYPEDCQVRK